MVIQLTETESYFDGDNWLGCHVIIDFVGHSEGDNDFFSCFNYYAL